MNIAIIHPDLGIGGAERLIVDAAIELKKRGHQITIYTSHHDPTHCFPETKKFKICVIGDWLPRSFFGYFYLLFAAIRSIYLAIYLILLKHLFNAFPPDLILADQITFHLPLLKLLCPVLFYCHFPDKLLAPKSDGILRRSVYRRIMDWAEEYCLLIGAKEIVVNSQFTLSKFKEAFKTIRLEPSILYPGVDTTTLEFIGDNPFGSNRILLSLNRFERKKDLNLAIDSFNLYHHQEHAGSNVKLILAGGYDARVRENREHLKELEAYCDKFNLKHVTLFRNDYENDLSAIDFSQYQVFFLPSISQETKLNLLKHSTCLVYTPSNEHFGIVPIEAMSQGIPVIAMNSGGPKETILNGVTGYLCDPNGKSISSAMECLFNRDNCHEMGVSGQERVKEMFSLKVFGEKLDSIVKNFKSK